MPRVATQPPSPKRARSGNAPHGTERNPRMIAQRPSKTEIRRRQLVKLAGPISAVISIALLLLFLLALSKSADPTGMTGRLREELGAATGMKIQHVVILHQKQTPQILLDEALAPDSGAPLIGTPILNYPLETARERLMQIPWIAQVTVERRLPGTLVIDLTEHDAFAIWQHQGRFVLIDRTGKPLPDVNVLNFKQLPLVVGEGAPQAAPALLDALAAQPAIQKRVTAMVRVGDRRWDLYLTNQVEVLLPQGHETAALTRLALLDAEDRLLERPLVAIDMRQADKLIIRLRPAPVPPVVTATSSASAPAPAKGAQ